MCCDFRNHVIGVILINDSIHAYIGISVVQLPYLWSKTAVVQIRAVVK